MGFFKDLKKISDQGKEIDASLPPMKDRMADASARLAAANQSLAAMAQGSMMSSIAVTNGVTAVATVTAARQTGAMMNFNPVVDLDLLVLMPNGVPLPVTRQEMVMQIHLPRCQPGQRLQVKVDPTDARNLWIDWVTPVA